MKTNKFLPDFVYGSIDGIITTFAVVAGVEGGRLSSIVILVLGISSLLADGFSMGVSKYLSDTVESSSKLQKLSALKGGVVTFVAFVLLGSIPLLVYILNALFGFFAQTFFWACIFTTFALMLVGYLKTMFLKEGRLQAIAETLLLGGVAALISYYVGYLMHYYFGI